jgi:hypothetical protein
MFLSGTVLGQGQHARRWYRCGVALVRKCRRFWETVRWVSKREFYRPGQVGRGSFWDKPFREYHFQTPLAIPSCQVICPFTGRQAAVGPSLPKTVPLVV